MKAICVWCRGEGRPGLVGEHPPLDEPREIRGICWVHKLQTLRGTRAVSGVRSRRDEETGRFLVIVARHDAELFARVSEQLLDDPRVVVILDRRRGDRREETRPCWRERRRTDRRQRPDYWEDTRYHPVIVVSTRKRSDKLTEHPPIPEVAPMETDSLTEARRRIDKWARDGQDVLNKFIPQLFAECEGFRQRAELAEAHSARLAREVDDLQSAVTRLQSEIDRQRRDGAEMADLVERTFTDVGRLASDVLDRVKGRQPR